MFIAAGVPAQPEEKELKRLCCSAGLCTAFAGRLLGLHPGRSPWEVWRVRCSTKHCGQGNLWGSVARAAHYQPLVSSLVYLQQLPQSLTQARLAHKSPAFVLEGVDAPLSHVHPCLAVYLCSLRGWQGLRSNLKLRRRIVGSPVAIDEQG